MEICVGVDVLVEVVDLRDVGCQWYAVIGFATDNPNPGGPPMKKVVPPY